MTPGVRVAAGLAAAVTAAIGLAGCSSGSSAKASDGKAPFTLKAKPVPSDRVDAAKSYKFEPAVIEVKTGTTVTWTNHDDFPHTVQILAGADPSTEQLGVGRTATVTFDHPGTVYYQCSLHPAQMKGEVVVTG